MNQRIWTIEEDNYIRENFGKTTFSAIAKHLSVSIATVENRAKALGFTIKEKTIRRWTTEEIELLKVMAPKYLNKTIAKKLNRSLNELNKKARDLGIKLIFKRPVWKKWKIKFLIENINKIPISRIQRELDVNYYQIMDKLEELNIEYHSTNWTPEEIELLTTLAPKVYITEIAKVINRTPGAIRSKAYKMDLDYITLDREYTEDEIEYIKNNWSIVPITDMARKLGVSRNMVQTQADIIGLPKLGNNPYRKWTEEEIARLKKLAKTKTIPQLAKVFKTTNDAIITIAYRQNITLIDSKVHWTDEDNKILRDLAKTLDLSELATAMNRSTSAIRLQAERLNIKIIPNKKHSQSIWTEENTKELKRLAA